MWVQFLASEDPLEEDVATHSSILAWKILWAEEPGRLQSIGAHKVRHGWSNLAWSMHGLQSTRLLCPWNSPGKSGLPFPPPGDLPPPGIEPTSPTLSGGLCHRATSGSQIWVCISIPWRLPSPLPASSLVGMGWGQRMCILNNFPGDVRPLVQGPYCIYYEVLPINISFFLKSLCWSIFSISS